MPAFRVGETRVLQIQHIGPTVQLYQDILQDRRLIAYSGESA